MGDLPAGLDGLDYRSQTRDVRRLGNQWFLVSTEPEPIAFVSWELGDPTLFGVGGAATAGKRFVGFVSEDPLVVAELVATLRAVPGTKVPGLPGAPAIPVVGTRAGDLLAAVSSLDPSASSAPAGAVVVPVGRGDDSALALAAREDRQLVLVDRGAEGLFGGWFPPSQAGQVLVRRCTALVVVCSSCRRRSASRVSPYGSAG